MSSINFESGIAFEKGLYLATFTVLFRAKDQRLANRFANRIYRWNAWDHEQFIEPSESSTGGFLQVANEMSPEVFEVRYQIIAGELTEFEAKTDFDNVVEILEADFPKTYQTSVTYNYTQISETQYKLLVGEEL